MAQANVPLDRRVVGDIVDSQKFQLASASIRELNAVAAAIEKRLGIRFIHMEFGIPGLHTDEVAIAGRSRRSRSGACRTCTHPTTACRS